MARDIKLIQISRKPRFQSLDTKQVSATTTSQISTFTPPITNLLIITDADNTRIRIGGHASAADIRLNSGESLEITEQFIDAVGVAMTSGTANVQLIGQR